MTTRRPSRIRIAATLAGLALVTAACGQKADVAQVATGGGGTASADGFGTSDASSDPFGSVDSGDLGTVDPATSGLGDTGGGTTGGSTGGSTGGTTGGSTGGSTGGTTGGTGTGGTDPGTGGGDATATTAPPTTAAPSGDRTGISETEIVIGVHAPVTGAAPVPQTAFEEGIEVYWKFIDESGGLFGRSVRVVFEDDEFNPQVALSKCKKMVEQDKVFLLVGGGGADQITQCAQYANSVGVPYLSPGVNEVPLRDIRAYFAVSESYSQQSPQLAQMITKMFGGQKLGIASTNSSTSNGAHESMVAAAQQAGIEVVYNKRLNPSINANQAIGIANEMRNSGAQVMYLNISPTSFLNIATAGSTQNFNPQWVGPGLTSGLNTVAEIGCQAARSSIDGAIFFSPFPQLDVIDSLDPDFRPAYGRHAGGEADDLSLALWGINKSIHQMFLAAGENVTRQSFVQTLESGVTIQTNVNPTLQYSAQNHLGAGTVHVLQADCESSSYKTIGQFVSGF